MLNSDGSLSVWAFHPALLPQDPDRNGQRDLSCRQPKTQLARTRSCSPLEQKDGSKDKKCQVDCSVLLSALGHLMDDVYSWLGKYEE